jgi:hypothetical protein
VYAYLGSLTAFALCALPCVMWCMCHVVVCLSLQHSGIPSFRIVHSHDPVPHIPVSTDTIRHNTYPIISVCSPSKKGGQAPSSHPQPLNSLLTLIVNVAVLSSSCWCACSRAVGWVVMAVASPPVVRTTTAVRCSTPILA